MSTLWNLNNLAKYIKSFFFQRKLTVLHLIINDCKSNQSTFSFELYSTKNCI